MYIYIEEYEDVSWFKLLDDLGREEVGRFSQFAKGNKYCVELLLGNIEILDEFINFISSRYSRYTFNYYRGS